MKGPSEAEETVTEAMVQEKNSVQIKEEVKLTFEFISCCHQLKQICLQQFNCFNFLSEKEYIVAFNLFFSTLNFKRIVKIAVLYYMLFDIL